MSHSLLLSHSYDLFANSHYSQRGGLSAFRSLMFFQDLMLRSRLTARLQLASNVAGLKEALCCHCSLPCHTLTGLPHTTHQSTHPAAALAELNSKNIKLFIFLLLSLFHIQCGIFIFAPRLHSPAAGSGNRALRAETKPDTHTAHSHYSSNFPPKKNPLLTSISRIL